MWFANHFAFTIFACILFTLGCAQIDGNSTSEGPQVKCRYVPGMYLGSRQRELECCNSTVEYFESRWATGELFLTRYLGSLQAWKCPQFEVECQKPTFAFTEYTKLVYDYFCNRTQLVNKCMDVVNDIVENTATESLQTTQPVVIASTSLEGSGNVPMVVDDKWNSSVEQLRLLPLGVEDLMKPCVQVALFDSEPEKVNNYHEIVHADIPGCDLVWCGIDGDVARSSQITAWTCMKPQCRSGITVIMVFCALLALIVTVANLTVIVVIFRNPAIRHSQAIYKLSLAFGDILVGLIVFPTFISTFTKLTLTPHPHGSLETVQGYNIYSNGTVASNLSDFMYRKPGGATATLLGEAYINFVGFFTTLSLMVSIYTLTVAGFDRLTAVYRPLQYRKDKAKILAKKICAGVWVCSVFFATLSFYVPGLQYNLIVSFLISCGGSNALILYALAFAVPMIIMWVVSLATYHSTRKHAQARRHLTKDSRHKTRSVENRLARTLSLMVGAFTVSLLPALVVLLVPLFTVSVYFSRPRDFSLSSASAFVAVEFTAMLIIVCNSLWNFFIYSARNLEFRRVVKVMYKDIAEKTKLAWCWDSTVICTRRVAHEGARRFSNIPSLSNSTAGGRKKSLASELTSTTKLRRESNTITNQTTSRGVLSSDVIKSSDASHSSTQDTMSKTNLESSTVVESKGKIYKPKYAKNPKIKGGKKEEDGKDASDDSIFNSFAIDANADRLFLSVMENIDEGIEEPENNKEKYEQSKA